MPLNSARGVLERIGFLCYLTLLVGSCGLIGLGLIFALLLHEPRPVLFGVAGVLVMVLLREHGYRHWHFRDWEESFTPSDGVPGLVFETSGQDRAEELERLLQELTDLDNTEERDVWTVQELRHRANALLARDPALREICAEALAGHPEVG